MEYDYVIVGAGLFGSVFAHEATLAGKKVLVLDKRSHIGGNIFTEETNGIQVHKYGAHIFHTNNKEVWDYVQQFVRFNRFTNSPLAKYKDELYNLPFNMNTFYKMWGTINPSEAKAKIQIQIDEANITTPKNLEEQAISLVGTDVYNKLIKGYTRKQWGRPCSELPSFIINRLPVRFNYDNNYFNDTYQGIPIGGYTQIAEKLLEGIEVKLKTDFFEIKDQIKKIAKKIVFTGMIDEYFDHCFGRLEYRSLRFETETLSQSNYQGNAVINYTDYEIPYTRIIEHKHFENQNLDIKNSNHTVITKEFPSEYKPGDEPYYPLNNQKNNDLYTRYKTLALDEKQVIFGGRLGMYKYFDMHHVIQVALVTVKNELKRSE